MKASRVLKTDVKSSQQGSARLGFWASLSLTFFSALAFAIGIMTPPRSGPFCTGRCIAYPFTDAVQFVPRDYLWIMPAMLLVPLFVIVVCCLSASVEERKKHLSLIAICFASISATIIEINYFIQLQVVEASLVHGENNGLALFTQYNPHGLFIALEDLGYMTLSAAFLFAGLAVPVTRAIGQAIRWTFLVFFLLSFVSFAYICWHFGLFVESRLEVTIITIVWTTLIVSGILFSIYFRGSCASRQTC